MRLSLKLTTLIYNKGVPIVRLLISAITPPFGAQSADPSGNAMPPSGTKTFCACFAARTNQVFEIVPFGGHWPTPCGADHTIWSCDPRSPSGARVPYSSLLRCAYKPDSLKGVAYCVRIQASLLRLWPLVIVSGEDLLTEVTSPNCERF